MAYLETFNEPFNIFKLQFNVLTVERSNQKACAWSLIRKNAPQGTSMKQICMILIDTRICYYKAKQFFFHFFLSQDNTNG